MRVLAEKGTAVLISSSVWKLFESNNVSKCDRRKREGSGDIQKRRLPNLPRRINLNSHQYPSSAHYCGNTTPQFTISLHTQPTPLPTNFPVLSGLCTSSGKSEFYLILLGFNLAGLFLDKHV